MRVAAKITGWNILRASVCAKMREIVYERAHRAIFCGPGAGFAVKWALIIGPRTPQSQVLAFPGRFGHFLRPALVAHHI
jgi:hypothetical protein